jgi:hypothetical protein
MRAVMLDVPESLLGVRLSTVLTPDGARLRFETDRAVTDC